MTKKRKAATRPTKAKTKTKTSLRSEAKTTVSAKSKPKVGLAARKPSGRNGARKVARPKAPTRGARRAGRALAATGARAVMVVEMSNNGPYDIRAIMVDQVVVFDNVSTSSPRREFDISAHFHPPARLGWEIFGGIQFPKAGVFLERPGHPTETLGQQAPLKKGVPWLDEKLVN